MRKLQGNIVNIFDNTIFFGEITIHESRIFNIEKLKSENKDAEYYMPGFVDAHVHIESSMLTPAQFAKMAVTHGTVATVSDPHEIANVLGVEGVDFMIEDGKTTPFKFCFGAPSCVPATNFETAGAEVSVKDIDDLLKKDEIGYLAEMMNFPGVLNNDLEINEKIKLAHKYGKPVDGHAPGLMGDQAQMYFAAGISTDHECYMKEEAQQKLDLGVKILVREGSAAKNFEELIPLAIEYSDQMMFCSDDKHPDELEIGHINQLVKRAIEAGVDMFGAIRMASLNPVRHYNLNVGLLREGEPADFIKVNNLKDLKVIETYIDGVLVAKNGQSFIKTQVGATPNNFGISKLGLQDLSQNLPDNFSKLRVIKVNDGQLITDQIEFESSEVNQPDFFQKHDVLKLVVVNRYTQSTPAIGFITGFGLKEGAIASSVAHDSHNIIAVGVDDESILDAINLIVREKGGISAVSNQKMGVLPLPVAGLMSNKDASEVSKDYSQIDRFSKEILGSTLKSPFMSLSFMALLVIPSLKLSDKGLFDGGKFEFVEVFEY